MKFNRTKNARQNIVFGFLNKIVTMLIPFVTRMIIIRVLGAEYLGLTSLFSSILHVLNISELGFSSAVAYSMYKPIAEDDKETLCAILHFYRRVYFAVGVFIAGIGLTLLPFLSYLIKGSYPAGIDIHLLYLIFLCSTVSSYLLFGYKNTLVNAYQRADVLSNINTLVHCVIYASQIAIIILTKNYYLYALMIVGCSVLQNICIEFCSRKMFPDIVCKGHITKETRLQIKTKVKGLLIAKLCYVTRNSFDSIFISAFLGLTLTAIYNNYYSIMNSVSALFAIIWTSTLSGIGNSITTESMEKNYSDMKKFNFIYMWLVGCCTVCLLCLYQPFMELFFGADMLLPFPAAVLFCLYFYILKAGDIPAIYSDACGLWWEKRFRNIAEALVNVILNFFLGKFYGIYGIISATLISIMMMNQWGNYIIYRHYFTKIRMREFYLQHLLYACATFLACVASYFICSSIPVAGILGLLAKALVSFSVSNLIFFLSFSRTTLFKQTFFQMKKILFW